MKTIKIHIDEKVRRFNEELHDSDRALGYKFDQEPLEVVITQLNINELPAHARSLTRAAAEMKGQP